jgi:hypothetical protein
MAGFTGSVFLGPDGLKGMGVGLTLGSNRKYHLKGGTLGTLSNPARGNRKIPLLGPVYVSYLKGSSDGTTVKAGSVGTFQSPLTLTSK